MSAKKVWSAPIALIVVVTALFFGGMTVLADTEPVAGGEFGDALTWSLDSEGTLNISGSGSMGSMSYGGAPWHDYTEQIKTIVIGNGVTDIGEYAFMYCTEATDVTIGNSVQFIDYGAFSYCYKLESVNIPSSVKNIKDGAFRDCSELIDVTLNNGLETIGYSAFINCSSLRNITIPETVMFRRRRAPTATARKRNSVNWSPISRRTERSRKAVGNSIFMRIMKMNGRRSTGTSGTPSRQRRTL